MDFVGMFNFFKDHGQEILNIVKDIFTALGMLYVSLVALIHLTPTKKDDAVLEKVDGFISKLSPFIHKIAGLLKVKK